MSARPLDGVVTFPEGLPGFEQARQFVLIASPDLHPFTVLQDVEAAGPSFVTIDPRQLAGGFSTDLGRADLARLQADGHDHLLWLVIVAAHEDGTATANLRAPLVINPASMRGIQVIAIESAYAVDHPLRAA